MIPLSFSLIHLFVVQKRAILHSCEIADLNCLKVADESNLIALSYGIFKSAKKMFSETEPVHIMFIDLGYTGYSVSVVDFMQVTPHTLTIDYSYTILMTYFSHTLSNYYSHTPLIYLLCIYLIYQQSAICNLYLPLTHPVHLSLHLPPLTGKHESSFHRQRPCIGRS